MLKISKISKVKAPLRPIRRLVRGAVTILHKIRPYHDIHVPVHRPRAPSVLPPPIPVASDLAHRSTRANNYRIALLSEVPEDDLIVISALAIAPFCCHADLLTMGVPQLSEVARVLNDALPPSLRIHAEAGCRPREIRAEIETVVGLRSPPPHLPVTSVRPPSQLHLESPVAHCSLINGNTPQEDMDYGGNISVSSLSPSPIGFGSRPPCSVSDVDVGTSPSLGPGSRLRHLMDQIPPRMSTPVDETQTNCELTFGLEGFTVEDPGESGSTFRTVDASS